MNLNQLYYFRTLAEYQHYTKAAAKLYISQPTLSNAIKSLEQELGCVLLKRSGRNVTLTEYGRMFYNTVCASLSNLDEGIDELQKKIKSDAGYINIACIPTSIGTRLPKLIRDFQALHTQSPYFMLHNQNSVPILEGLTNGDYDIGICSRDDSYTNLHFSPLFNEPFVVIVPPDHSLAQETRITPAMLQGQDVISYHDGIPIGADVRRALGSAWDQIHFTELLDGEITIGGQVVANHSIGIVADTILLDTFDLVRIPLDVSPDARRIYIAYNQTRQLSEAARTFIDFLKAHQERPLPHE